ncbi:MAG: transporter ATP-binding protein [Frankiales bacterium]|nr:transporter ATP-binding protein [Frankiales bacterium]
MDGEPAVRARGLTKRYGDVTAVDAMELDVPVGVAFGLLGPNGAGKTTFMRMLFGLVRPDAGSVEVFGRNVADHGVAALAPVAGFVESPRFYPYLSGRANLEVLARLDQPYGDGPDIDLVLETVDLTDRQRSRVREYSYGMVQRLGVAAALLRNPQLLVVDEPTNGLDPAGIRDMRELIARLAGSGITVLLSSHNMLEVEQVCDRVAIMRRGGIAFDGSITDLRAMADDVGYRLTTEDDRRALELCEHTPGLHRLELGLDGLRFEASQSAVEDLTRRLGAAGIGTRELAARTTALETLFFRLTESRSEVLM